MSEHVTSDEVVRRIGRATLYLGDAYELLPTLAPGSVDVLISDPPYAAAAATAVTGRARETWGMNWADMTLVQLLARQAFTCPALKAEHGAYWFCDHLSHAAIVPWLFNRYPLLQTIVWDKDMLGMGGSYRKQTELILYVRTSDGPKVIGTQRDIIRLKPDYARRVHPTEKPLELMSQLVRASEWDTCLDPFMGSGTTGIACARAARGFIGIESDPAHFRTACRRIAEAYEWAGVAA